MRSAGPWARMRRIRSPARQLVDARKLGLPIPIQLNGERHLASQCFDYRHFLLDPARPSNGTGRPHRCGGIISGSEHTTQTGGAVTSPKATERQGSPPSAPREPSDHAPSLDRRESVSARWREALSVVVELAGNRCAERWILAHPAVGRPHRARCGLDSPRHR